MSPTHIFKRLSKLLEKILLGPEDTVPTVQANMCNPSPPPYTEIPSRNGTENASKGATPPPSHGKNHQLDYQCTSPRRAPPPSDTNPYPLMTLYQDTSIESRVGGVTWVLMDILAATFRKDHWEELQNTKASTPMLTGCRAVLLEAGVPEDDSPRWDLEGNDLVVEMCTLVHHLQDELTRNRWLLVHPKKKCLAEKMLLEPIDNLGLDFDFCLELMGRHRRSYGCSKPESTALDFWSASPRATDLGDVIASHALLIDDMVMEDEVRQLLNDYIEAFQKEKKLEELRTSKEFQDESFASGMTCRWPLSEEYVHLATGIRSFKQDYVIHDPYEPSRTRMRVKRNLDEMGKSRISLI